MAHVLPGSFPSEQTQSASHYQHLQHRTQQNSQYPLSFHDADADSEQFLKTRFQFRELAASKTTLQKDLVAQLDTLAYFLIGYQFLKYTRGSCLPPTAAHILVQVLLYARDFGIAGPRLGRQIYADHLNSQQRTFLAAGRQFDRRKIVQFIVAKTRNLIVWKFIACLVYHVLLVLLYLRPVANAGRLHLLENGSWYIISFVGESLPQNYLKDDMLWSQLWKLGLCGLLLTDTLILVVQLVLYQGIFAQSTISPQGLRLNEREINILRPVGVGQGEEVEVEENGVPVILHVKLYEALGDQPVQFSE